jgi:Fic family protein
MNIETFISRRGYYLFMDERLFTNTPFGKLLWEQKGAYYYFEPNLLPFKFTESQAISKQAEKTTLLLGVLKGMTRRLSSEEIFLMQYPFMLKEAQLSSEIEGTRSTIVDVMKEEKIEEKNPEKRLDNEEIRNYRKALQMGLDSLSKQKISEELIKSAHKILLEGVRGKNKSPGEYKEDQNGIGNRKDTLDIAKFVPASPRYAPKLMENLVEFMNSDSNHSLYRIALSHYQFETIHPFRDGNGRLGRLLIMLQICENNLLDYPLLYISEFFNRNRDAYTELLFNVSAKGDLESWITFFLKALEYQAQQSIDLLEKLEKYKLELHQKMHKLSKSPNMPLLIESLFKQPFITSRDVKGFLDISQPGSWNLIKKLEKLEILEEVEVTKEGKVYCAKEITKIILGRN